MESTGPGAQQAPPLPPNRPLTRSRSAAETEEQKERDERAAAVAAQRAGGWARAEAQAQEQDRVAARRRAALNPDYAQLGLTQEAEQTLRAAIAQAKEAAEQTSNYFEILPPF